MPSPDSTPPQDLTQGGPEAWAHYRRAARPERSTGALYAATHRIDTTGLPPLFVLSERRALAACQERGRQATIHVRDQKSGRWLPWRAWP